MSNIKYYIGWQNSLDFGFELPDWYSSKIGIVVWFSDNALHLFGISCQVMPTSLAILLNTTHELVHYYHLQFLEGSKLLKRYYKLTFYKCLEEIYFQISPLSSTIIMPSFIMK